MKRFKELVRETAVEPDVPSQAALTYKEKPNKEPMPKLKEETDTTEKVEMVQSQLHFIKYACEEILDYIEQGGEVEEWYQVKVAKSFSEFESLHAFIEGESRRTGMKEEVDSEKGDYDVPVTYRHKVDGKTQEVNKTYRVKNAMSHRHASNIGMKLGRRDAEKAGHNAHWMNAGWKKIEEETEQLDEGRPSQRHPLEGHEYHKKSDADLVHIAKDAHKAAEAMKSHNTTAENKYRDQANDSATVRYFRQKNGMPDWYKKKYGHMKEEVETPPIHVRSLYTQTYAKHGGTIQAAKSASEKAYAAVEKKHGTEMRDKLQAFHARNMNEEVEQIDEISANLVKKARDVAYSKGKEEQSFRFSRKHYEKEKKESDAFGRKMAEEKEEPPFEGGTKKPQQKAVAGKYGSGYSTARHLARQALKKQVEKLKPVKESLDESRKSEIVKEIVKKKKNDKENTDTFQKEPVLSSEIVKA